MSSRSGFLPTLAASCLIERRAVLAQAIPPPRQWPTTASAASTGDDPTVRHVRAAQPLAEERIEGYDEDAGLAAESSWPEHRPIDLNTALRLAGVQNPQLMIARQRVLEAAVLRQLAAAQFLPSLNLGTNYDSHTGNCSSPTAISWGSTVRRCTSAPARPRSDRARSTFRGSFYKETSPPRFTVTSPCAGSRPAGVCHPGDPQPDIPANDAGVLRTPAR